MVKQSNKEEPVPVALAREKPGRKKTECPLTKEEFVEAAEALPININGAILTAEVKEYKTGSFGWFCNGKLTIMVGDKPVKVQLGLTMTAVGSKSVVDKKKASK